MQSDWPKQSLFGVPIHALSMAETLSEVNRAVRERSRLLIGVVNAAKLVNMRRDPELGSAVMSANLILADGMAVVWACRLLGRRLPGRVAGIDLMEKMLEQAQEKGYRVYCLGATHEVLGTAVARMRDKHPGVQIVGSHHGYFEIGDEAGVADEIRRAGADILFVAITSPKKEEFLARWADHMSVPVCHGVGGAFDVLAGKVRRAPMIWQRLGLEWLYRIVQEPRRMWRRYLVTNTMFSGMLAGEMIRRVRQTVARQRTDCG